MKTGTTNQTQYSEETRIDNTIYAPGVYNSHDPNDALPRQPEYYILTEKLKFIANTVPEVFALWASFGCSHPIVEKSMPKSALRLPSLTESSIPFKKC